MIVNTSGQPNMYSFISAKAIKDIMKYTILTCLMLLSTMLLPIRAQDALIDIDIDKTEWYENPYLWLGIAAFVTILIVVTRRKKA